MLSQLHDTVVDEIANASLQVDTRRKALEAAKVSLELARETLTLVREQHRVGTASQLDLLQAQDALIVSGVDVARARFDLEVAEIELDRSMGEFPPQ